ncbi:helix-turn-helix domain-containing protein [Paroceanicella profunda]|uniref:Helix-turn-helix domain-containing protein n=1 Tax=Paroceanicella profunda TaxID=2579971 RepID=A0A5B8FH70_9RHOB|nr:XRE family transcriptional regulator [Paroceanicella profunda]QDL91847.1 helix-turn-helix domain-containing protein [Paroceanicella profunda]
MPGSLAGLRIRERRLALGLTQVDLAARAGISPSYLNLIEKNRRAVAGRVLLALARALDMPPADFTGAAEQGLLAALQEAATAHGVETARTEDLIGRFPDWARLLAGMLDESQRLRRAVTALSDRLAHDPFLGQSVHEILTNVTAIRSTTDILADPGEMSAAQRGRFHDILAQESARLTEVAQALATYFDSAATATAPAATPEEALDQFLDAHEHQFPALDADPGADLAPLLEHEALGSAPARRLAEAHLARYAADARLLPLAEFAARAAELRHDPLRLAAVFAVPPERVFRRLATLRRDGLEAPPMACLQVSAAGHVLMRRPLPGLPLPRHGRGCPLWPLFDALSHPGEPRAATCALPDGAEYLALALATPLVPPGFGARPVWQGSMLLVPLVLARRADMAAPPGEVPPEPVGPGPGCRMCPRQTCVARAEPSVLS